MIEGHKLGEGWEDVIGATLATFALATALLLALKVNADEMVAEPGRPTEVVLIDVSD